jgi:predicted GNAT family acetyltransferase
LQVLSIVNPLYADVPIHDFDDDDNVTALQQRIPELILENAHVTTDEQTLRIERSRVSSSAAGLGGARELIKFKVKL